MRMKLAWLLVAAPLAAAAAGPAPDKPPAGASPFETLSDEALMYRTAGLGACVSAHQPGKVFDPQVAYLITDCECALDRFIAGRDDVSDLPDLDENAAPIEPMFAACRAERVAQNPASAGPAASPALKELPAISPDPPTFAPPDEEWPSGGRLRGYGSWLDARGIPIWLGIFGPIVLAVAIGWWLSGPRRRRDDLVAPPRWMRSGHAKPPPPTPPSERPDDPIR